MSATNSVYKRGASDGLVMGIILMVVFLMQSFGTQGGGPWMPLLLAGNILTLAVPVAAYIMLRRSYREEPGLRTFSAVWMHGIVTFLCASLILGLTVYIFLRLIAPDFTVSQMRLAADLLRQAGDADSAAAANTIKQVIDHHMIPSPIEMAFASIWLCSFGGAMLSMVIAAIIKIFPPKATKQ